MNNPKWIVENEASNRFNIVIRAWMQFSACLADLHSLAAFKLPLEMVAYELHAPRLSAATLPLSAPLPVG
jgi:hypothetical protein